MFEERCTLTGGDERAQGSWTFTYAASLDEGAEVHSGALVVEAGAGGWEGELSRTVAAPGPTVEGPVQPGPVWSMGGSLTGVGQYEGLELWFGGEGGVSESYHLTAGIELDEEGESVGSRVRNLVLGILVWGAILALLGTPAVIATLKGRWWMGVIGFVAFVGAFIVTFGLFGISEPSEEFQDTLAFRVGNTALQILWTGGLGLLIVGALLKPRPGSWWDRNRSRQPTEE